MQKHWISIRGWVFTYKHTNNNEMKWLLWWTHLKWQRNMTATIYIICLQDRYSCNATLQEAINTKELYIWKWRQIKDDLMACALKCQIESIIHYFIWKRKELHRDYYNKVFLPQLHYLDTYERLLLKMPFLIPSIAFKLCFWRVWEETEEDSSFYTLFQMYPLWNNVSAKKLAVRRLW